jgi:hypothetical protein
MDINVWCPIFSAVVAAYVTPLIMSLWSRLSPPSESSRYDGFSEAELKRRNNWINNVAIVLALLGIWAPLTLYVNGLSKHNPWPVGLGFGLMVILPVAFVSLVTLPKGVKRYGEFWRFYELKYKIGLRSIAVVYWLLGLLGVLSAYKLVF